MRKIILIAAFAAGCTSPNDAYRALNSAGFTDIEIYGYDPWACSEDDFYHTKFSAVNPLGNRVDGTVCSGLLFKNATIRY